MFIVESAAVWVLAARLADGSAIPVSDWSGRHDNDPLTHGLVSSFQEFVPAGAGDKQYVVQGRYCQTTCK